MLVACMSPQRSVEMNIQRLKEAEAKLVKNPHDNEALAFLLNQLHDQQGVNRVNAAAILGDAGKKVGEAIKDRAVPALSELLDKGDMYDKRAAAEALAQFGPHAQAAVPILRENLTPSDRDVAWFSARALGEIGEPAHEAVPDLMKAIKENIGGCKGEFSSFCESFIPAIGKIGAPARSAVPDLQSLLSHSEPYVRMRLAIAIIRIDTGNQPALQTLESLLKSSDTEVRRSTMDALAECGKKAEPARKLIQASLNDSNQEVRESAAGLLRVLDGK